MEVVIDMSPEEEFRESLAAAEAGDSYEMLKTAINYITGYGVSKDLDAASRWLIKSEETDDPYYLSLLGEYFEFGTVFDKDIKRAVNLYMKAREISPLFSYMLGRHYHLKAADGSSDAYSVALDYYLESSRLAHVPSLAGIYGILKSGYKGRFWQVLAILFYPFAISLVPLSYIFIKNSYQFWKSEDFSSRLRKKKETVGEK